MEHHRFLSALIQELPAGPMCSFYDGDDDGGGGDVFFYSLLLSFASTLKVVARDCLQKSKSNPIIVLT